MLVNALRQVFNVNLGVKRTERVLLFSDRPTRRETVGEEDRVRREKLRDITNLVSEVGAGLCRRLVTIEYPATGAHGKEPPRKLWEAAFGLRAVEALDEAGLMGRILRKRIDEKGREEARAIVLRHRREAVDAVVALSNYSTSHTTFRDFLTGLCGTRYASMPLFDIGMLQGAMTVDYRALARRTKAVARVVGKAERVDLGTPNGTVLSMLKKGRKAHADTGMLKRAGSFGNLPAGEVFFAPLEGSAEGRLVLQWAPTRELASPVTLTVKEGLVTGITGSEDFAIELEGKLSGRKENRNIAELGIGTNERARRPDNILESEKILGTVHVALGDNSSFGGNVKTPFHQDFVFFRPTLVLTDRAGNKETLLKDGKLMDRGYGA
jgi:leucyl aminopeptidase (aminopeptidase T)